MDNACAQSGRAAESSADASSLGLSAPTVMRYTDLLVDLALVRRLPPSSGNIGKRLVKSPKMYVRDSGVVHTLLELASIDDLLGHSVAGPSYEGFAIETLVACAGKQFKPYFYRSHDGAEVDLNLESGGKPVLAIEIKRSTAPVQERGFSVACDDLKIDRRFIVYPGVEQYKLRSGVEVIPLADLARLLQGTQ